MYSKARILIVEDDPILTEKLELDLIEHGYNIAGSATNISDAVRTIKTGGADLALIDIGLQGPEDGVFTAEEILRTKALPIIYMTGRTLMETLPRIRQTSPSAFLQKPLRTQELLAQIELALYNFRNGNLPSVYWERLDRIYVPYIHGYLGLYVADILFITSDSTCANIYLSASTYKNLFPGKPYNFLKVFVPMGTLLRELPPDFIRLSRFTVINLDRIDRISEGAIILENHELSIPTGGRNELLSKLRIIQRGKRGSKPLE